MLLPYQHPLRAFPTPWLGLHSQNISHQKVPPSWHESWQVCVDGVVVAPAVPALLPWGRGRRRGWREGGRAGTRDSLVNPQSAWGVSGPSERR